MLGYINIGEAEDYRYYWQPLRMKSPPAWLGTENCRWGDSFQLWGEEKGLSHIDVCDMSGFKRRGFDILGAYAKLLGSLGKCGF